MINLEKTFKNIILIHVLIFCASSVWEIFLANEDLINLSNELDESALLSNTYLIIFAVITLIVYLLNLFFLYKFYSFSKNLFCILLILFYAQFLFAGITIFEPFGYFLDDLFALSQGVILALLFFTPLKEKF